MSAPDLGGVLAALDTRYPPRWASPWDAVGLVCGDRSAAVASVLFAVDPVAAVVDEAVARGVDLIVTHHPLFLTPVHGVATDTAKGLLVHRLIKHDIALFVAHTNADVAAPGVSDALGRALGVADLTPMAPPMEAAFDDVERGDFAGATGLGRIGDLPEAMRLEAFVHLVADSLPVGRGGVRATGDPDRLVQRVAVCGGAGDSLLARAADLGADVYVTGDLRHHRAGEHVEDFGAGGPALIDATHYGTEWPWLEQAADLLVRDLAVDGATVEAHVSTVVTDPWTMHASSGRSPS